MCKANCLLFRVCALTAYKEGQLWTVSWCNSLIPRCLAVPYGLIQEVQLMSQALVVVILDIPSKGCCILVCAMAANSSMSVTHRLIPGALSVLSLSQACMYTLRPTLLILLFLPSLSLSLPLLLCCLQFLFISLALPLLYLPCPHSSLLRLLCYQRRWRVLSPRTILSVAGLMQSKPHTRKGTEMEIKYIQRKNREALSAPTGFRPSINFAINRIPLLPLLLHSHDVSPSLVEDAANTHVLCSALHTDASSVFSN